MKIAIIGQGKVGEPMKEAYQEMGYKVIGIDSIKGVGDTTDFSVIKDTEIVFIIVPTPSNKDGSFSTEIVFEVAKEIKKYLTNQLVVLCSTVCVGDTRKLQEFLGCDVCYNPFFIRLGSVKEDILNPDFILIGESGKKAGDRLEKFYINWLSTIKRMSLENAELTKIGVNTFLTTKISFANNLAELCEKIEGGDIDLVTDAIGSYSAIGRSRLKGGTSYGGPCLPRDNKALSFVGRRYGVIMSLAQITDQINDYQIYRLFMLIDSYEFKSVYILGQSYKEDVGWDEESAGLRLYKVLKTGIPPLKVEISDKLPNKEYDVIVVTTPRLEYKELKTNGLVIDCWRILDKTKYKKYIALGKNETSIR